MNEPITVVIADDHPIFRKGLRDIIAADARFHVAGEAGDGPTALALIEKLLPRIAVLDVEMPGLTGIDVTRRIAAKKLPVSVIILTMYDDDDMFTEAMECGAMGYMLKDSAITDIARGLVMVAAGEFFVSSAMTSAALHGRGEHDPQFEQRVGLHHLTPAERSVLRLIAAEKSTQEIAVELHISRRTVDNHRHHICSKLNLTGAYALIRFAVQHRLII
jgi:DNA-binding NarL/FixJ family response regulator